MDGRIDTLAQFDTLPNPVGYCHSEISLSCRSERGEEMDCQDAALE